MANSNLTDNDMQCSMLMTVLDGQYLRENDEILSFADVDLFFMAAINSAWAKFHAIVLLLSNKV